MATFKTCPNCGQAFPPAAAFCTNCGEAITDVQVRSLYGNDEHYWALPEYLRDADRWRRDRDTGAAGSGLIWIGALFAVVPFLSDPTRRLSLGSFAIGLALIVAGLIRMRSSARTLARAGLLANGGALIALVFVISRFVIPAGSHAPPSPTAVAIESEIADANSADAVTLSGETAMFRGDSAHTGVLIGPAPSGDPLIRWRYDSGGEITGSAATAGGFVYFTGKRGDLYAVDASTGELKWQAHLGNYISSSTPAIANGKVFVAGGYALFAFNASTGEQLWKLPLEYVAQSSPVVDQTRVYVASQTGRLYAVDAESGAQIWSYDSAAIIFGAPAVANGLVYIGTDSGDLHAVQAASGHPSWKTTIGGAIFASPAVANGLVVVEARGETLAAVDAGSGQIKWKYGISGQSSVAIAGNTVIAGTDDGGIHAIDLTTGKPKWLFPTGSQVLSSPVVVGSTVYVASGLNLYAIALDDGNGIWRFSATDTIEASAAIANDTIYIGSRDGYLYAVGGDNGTPTP